jgi:hypothetical protein
MGRSVRLLSVAALVAAPLVLGLAAPAGARSAAPRFASAVRIAPTAAPNSNVLGKGATLHFKPGKLAVNWSGPPPVKACKQSKFAFTVTNTSKQTIQVTLDGDPFGPSIPKGAGIGVCGWGRGDAKLVLGVDGSAKVLKVNFS